MHAALAANSSIGPIGRFLIAGDLILIGRGLVLVGGDLVAVGRRLILVRGCLVAVGNRLIPARSRLIYCKNNRVVSDPPLFPMGNLLPICALQLVVRVSQLLTPDAPLSMGHRPA